MGILIDKADEVDRQVYEDAWKDVESIMHNADDFAYIRAPKHIEPEKNNNETIQKTVSKNEIKNDVAKPKGFCVRTGVEIPFNIEKPLSYEAYKLWSKDGDKDHHEKFCHFSGEPSNGETSVSKPILKKNWKKAKETFGL